MMILGIQVMNNPDGTPTPHKNKHQNKNIKRMFYVLQVNMWNYTTTQNLAIQASYGYPFLFAILGGYIVSVYYIKDTINAIANKTIAIIEKGSLRKKTTILTKEIIKRNRLDFVFYCWNIALSLFSFIGAMNLYPELVRKIGQNTYRDFWCETIAHYSPTTLEWLSYFHLSKFVEFGDTLFLVLRGKDVPFLHIYHHITVAAISWGSIETMPSHILTGAFINYSVHSIMYLYFALQLYGKVPTWFRSYWITYIQILQMAIGIYGSMETYYYIIQDATSNEVSITPTNECVIEPAYAYVVSPDMETIVPKCGSNQGFVAAGLLLYVSYLWLFIDFYQKKTKKIEFREPPRAFTHRT